MGYGTDWNKGNGHEFENLDFGFNTAPRTVLEELSGELEKWDRTKSDREPYMKLLRTYLFADLWAQSSRLDTPENLRQERARHADEASFMASIDDQLTRIQKDWFGGWDRTGSSHWIYDARVKPAEVEAMMVEATKELLNLLLDGPARRVSCQGQCEWPEFSIQLSLDESDQTVDMRFYGPDNATPSDGLRRTVWTNQDDEETQAQIKSRRSRGRPRPSGTVECHRYLGRVPEQWQVVPYLPQGPIRQITEFRWRLAGEQPADAGAEVAGERRPPLLALGGPIADAADPVVQAQLDEAPGNVLRSHRRAHVALLLLRFDPQCMGGIRQKLSALPVTHAGAAAPGRGEDGDLFVGCGLSATGYRSLVGAKAAQPADSMFRRGMRDEDMRRLVDDPDLSEWDGPYRDGIDGVLILAHNEPAILDAAVRDYKGHFQTVCSTVEVDSGSVRRPKGQSVEAFQFRDNVSQPLFFEDDLKDQLKKSLTLEEQANEAAVDQLPEADGRYGWKQGFPPSQVLVVHQEPGHEPLGYGSYLVLRKLEQNVAAFETLRAKLAQALDPAGAHPDEAGAQVIGRIPTGQALQGRFFDKKRERAAGADDFSFEAPTPTASHVRRVNDRTGRARLRVMARRGVPYPGQQPGEEAPPPSKGLLFMACMWDITAQFVEVQAQALHPLDGGSPDLLLGRGRRWWTDPTGAHPPVEITEQLVTMKGGEYLYLPPPRFFSEVLAGQANR